MSKTLNTQLTPRQAQLFGYIDRFGQKKNYSPTLSNMANHFGVSIHTVHQHVDYLERKGYLVRQKGVKHSIRLIRNMSDLASDAIASIYYENKEKNNAETREDVTKKITQKENPRYEFFLGDSL